MSIMSKREQVTNTVTVVQLDCGEHAFVMVKQIARRPDGKERVIVQKVSVTDRDLVCRLSFELRPGDRIAATIVTEWSTDAYDSRLTDFTVIAETVVDKAYAEAEKI